MTREGGRPWFGRALASGRAWRYIVLALVLGGLLGLLWGERYPSAPSQPSPCIVTATPQVLSLQHCQATLYAPTWSWAGLLAPDDPQQWRHERIHLDARIAAPLERVLSLGVPDARVIQVSRLRTDGTAESLLDLNHRSPFAQRPAPEAQLGLPVVILPGPQVLELRYHLHLGGRLQARLLSSSAFQTERLRADLLSGGMVGGLFALLGVVVVYHRVARQSAYLAYAGLVMAQLLLLLQIGGQAFALFWPDAPEWNQYAPAVLATWVIVCHALFAAGLFRLRERHRRLCMAHRGVLVLAALNLVPWGGVERLVAGSVLLAGVYAPLALGTAAVALRERLPGTRLYVLGLGALAVFSFGLFFLGIIGHNPLPQVDFFLYPKIGALLEIGFFAAALVDQVRLFQAQQAEQRQRRLADAQALVQAEADRLAAQARAEQKSLQLASAGHDIAQPLASLRMVAQVLRQTEGSAPVSQHLERVLDHTQALLRDLVERERREHRVHSQSVMVGDVLAELVLEHRAAAQAKGVVLRYVDSQVEILVSPLILGRVLRNLLSNALRYTPSGRVVLGVRRRGGGVELQVLDTGPGLAAAQVETLLRPFEQGRTGAAEGFGLGLFIVRSLCEQAGWALRIRSRVGRGSCFAVWIPPGQRLS